MDYKYWKDMCDTLWSLLIRAKYKKCYFPLCGKKTEEACHTIQRRMLGTRWEPLNGLGGCRYHNQWEERHPDEARNLKISIIGKAEYGRLERKAKEWRDWKPTIEQLENIAMGLEKRLWELGITASIKNYRKARNNRSNSARKRALQRFKDGHGGLSPDQVKYRLKKALTKRKKNIL